MDRRKFWPLGGEGSGLVWGQDLYRELDRESAARQYYYRELFKHQLPAAKLHEIRECLAYNHPLGNERFRGEIESVLGRRVESANAAARSCGTWMLKIYLLGSSSAETLQQDSHPRDR